jgi:hypothetical protein
MPRLAAALLISFALAAAGPVGCRPADPQRQAQKVVIDPPRPAEVKAAEHFRLLAEEAFTAEPAALDASILNADAAVKPLRSRLPLEAQAELDRRLSDIRAARAAPDRLRLALAAAEVYHILTASISDQAPIPREVYLIGYAALRYDADVKAEPTRWADMVEAAALAGHAWAQLAPKVTDEPLRLRVERSLPEMAAAAAGPDTNRARLAAQSVSQRVGELETYFMIARKAS